MKAIEAALAYTSGLGIRSMEVPEWPIDGRPLKVFWKPMTLEERELIFKGGDMKLTDYAEVLFRKALDADGTKLFDLDDKIKLAKFVESGVVQRIALEILRSPKIEDLEKN